MYCYTHSVWRFLMSPACTSLLIMVTVNKNETVHYNHIYKLNFIFVEL